MTTLPEHLDHPAVRVMCSTCTTFEKHVTLCEEIKCCFAYQRRGHEQRVKDEAAKAKDARGRNV